MRFPTSIALAVVLCTLAVSCRPAPTTPSGENPSGEKPSQGRPADQAANSPLSPLHLAAEEAALDAFQFGKKTAGWPGDTDAKSGADYFALLLANGYLKSSLPAGSVQVANAREEDPLATALFAQVQPSGRVLIIRKDGKAETFSSQADADRFAPPPPRDPAWLP
jgi:hypothetical protein